MSSTDTEYDLNSPFYPNGACDHCHKRKIRCDKAKPHCTQCKKRGVECNYGLRLKRGPKIRKPRSQKADLKNTQKSSAQLHALLFEIEFHKKIAELWKRTCLQEGSETNFRDFSKSISPKFSAETEEFIRSPTAVTSLMDDFDYVYRILYSATEFAANRDFATKIWQAIIDIPLNEFLSMLNTFETSLLLAMLEYFVLFLLCLKLAHYDDISTHLSTIVFNTINTIVYARDITTTCLASSQLTLQFIASLVMLTGYFKQCKSKQGMQANSELAYELFSQHKQLAAVNRDLEIRLCVRMLMNAKSVDSRDVLLKKLKELDYEPPPNLQYHIAYHVSVKSLDLDADLTNAETNIIKANYYIEKCLETMDDQGKRAHLEKYFYSWIGVIHSEIAFRLGNADLARKKMGDLLNTFPQLAPAHQRLLISNCEYLMYAHHNLLIQGYLDLMKPERMYKQPSLRLLLQGHHNTIQVNTTVGSNTIMPALSYEGEEWQNNNYTDETSNSNSNENNSSSSGSLDLQSPHSSDNASPVSLEFYDHVADPFFIDDQMGSFDFPDVNSVIL